MDEELKFFISEESELINGFKAYKLTIQRDGTNEIWFSKTLREPDFVIKIKNEILILSSVILILFLLSLF